MKRTEVTIKFVIVDKTYIRTRGMIGRLVVLIDLLIRNHSQSLPVEHWELTEVTDVKEPRVQ